MVDKMEERKGGRREKEEEGEKERERERERMRACVRAMIENSARANEILIRVIR